MRAENAETATDVDATVSRRGAAPRGRATSPRPAAPTVRAMLGGFLVAASGLAVFLSLRQAGSAATTRYVVVTRQVAEGEVLERGDLGLAPAEIPAEMAQGLTEDWRDVAGKEATRVLDENGFVPIEALAAPGSTRATGRRLSLELGRAEALDGALDVGASVDVIAAPDNGGRARTVANGARVVAIGDQGSGDLGGVGAAIVTIDVGSRTEAVEVIGAQSTGRITLATRAPRTREPDDG